MNFHDVNLPKFIQVFAIGQPTFLTSVATTISGRELRNLDRENALQKYSLKNCCLSIQEFEEFNSFFRARRGKSFSFRFTDPADCIVVNQRLADGNGIIKQFQLFKLYNDLVMPYMRKITRPHADSVNLYINNSKIEGAVDYNTGIVELQNPLGRGDALTTDFMFDVMVRFSSDSFDYTYRNDGTIELSTIELIEVHN